MKYAIVKCGGKQYKVTLNSQILVDQLKEVKPGNEFNLVALMVRDENQIFFGEPEISSYKVTARLIENQKGEKIDVARFKAKVRHRRRIGFRPKYSKILIEKINPVRKPVKNILTPVKN